LEQFNTCGIFEPKSATDLTDEDKRKALASLIFLKEKQNGDIKACSCANGSVQWEHIVKEEAAAPTVALESMFITSAIDEKENQNIVTIDIPGAFLHADNEDYVLMKMVGTLAELNMGFTINPYDPCIANKMVNGSQMSVRWHVDDLMISHAVHDDMS